MVRLKNVAVEYPALRIAYEDALFLQNAVTVVTGRNGSGKTTLLKAIGGLIAHEGEIEKSGFATIHFQDPVLFDRSVYKNIVYPLEIRGRDARGYEKRILEYARLMGLKEKLHENAKNLSAGQKMKTSILRSVIFEPEILLLDEPTTYLDIESIEELKTLVCKLKEKMTIILVCHDQAFNEAVADEVYHVGG